MIPSVGSRITVRRVGINSEVIDITGKIIKITEGGLITIEHKYGICYEQIGSGSIVKVKAA